MNQNSNFKDIGYVTQEEINKMSQREKFFPPCKCGKKGELRWRKDSSLSYQEGKEIFYPALLFKGKNGEEACHKCAPCVKCGKEGFANNGRFDKHEKTNDNPSGEWILAHCSIECYNGTEKPNLPKEEPWQDKPDNICNYCGKLTWVKFGNSSAGKTFCSRDCFVAAGNKIQKGKCRIAGCSREAYYECMDLCLSHSKPCRGGKIRPNGERCNAAMGVDEGDICEFCQKHNETYKDNSPIPNPAASQPITNSNDQNNNSVSSSNSPKPNPGKIKITLDTRDNRKNNSNANSGTNENQSNRTLVISLKDIKQISLKGNDLVIEFNGSESQTVISEQEAANNQELSKVKNYLRDNRLSSVSQQALEQIINSNSSNSLNPASKKPEPLFWMGLGLAGTLMLVGLPLLIVKIRKKSLKKK
ncbi:MAG: hypothetical protein I3273_01260 [Candidatus Moeniiplasma glomeromycotorum]|nr:hypothetical protein [Candidatus Moeniiplasma glomeromycotorum]MCE8167249.1 hypothetical protein [Candidatus Moeniiplasma glomeromycotorum]MCE8168738.1 hypothetical protein [Candidatus Moeniiplasma glomeromycotorum]